MKHALLKTKSRLIMSLMIVIMSVGRFYKFNLSLANSQNLIKATANVILLSQI